MGDVLGGGLYTGLDTLRGVGVGGGLGRFCGVSVAAIDGAFGGGMVFPGFGICAGAEGVIFGFMSVPEFGGIKI